MKINVITPSGRKTVLEIDGSHTLDDLKSMIQDVEGVPPDQQRLIFGGVQLVRGSVIDQIEKIRLNQDERDRARSSIDVWLIMRLRGGGNQIYHRPVRHHDDDDDDDDDEVPPRRKLIRSSASSRPMHSSQYHHVPFRVSKIKRTSQSSYGASDDDDGHDKSSSPRRSSSRVELDRTRRRSSSPDDETSTIRRELRKPLKSSGARLQITIKHVAGYEICVEIEPLDTFDDLKQKIFDKEGISPDDQRFIFKGLQLHEGVVYDQVKAILARLNESRPMSWALPDTKTIHVTITMVLPLRGGGNGIYHEVQFNRSSSSEHDSDRENPKDGTSSRQLALVQDQSQTPFSRDRLRRFGFGSKTTAHPALIGSSRTTNKGSESEENTRSNFGEVKYCVQGRESQVLFGISDLAREKIQQKETKSLHCEGIDQIIQGLYSLDLFRSRAVADGEKRTEELMDQILELSKKISEMEGELANQKEVAKDAEDRSFNRGYESACRDIEECIANEHPEWDLSFIQS